jgi:hypothetical protein
MKIGQEDPKVAPVAMKRDTVAPEKFDDSIFALVEEGGNLRDGIEGFQS